MRRAFQRAYACTYERRRNKEKKNADTVTGKERNRLLFCRYPRIDMKRFEMCSGVSLPTLLLRARARASALGDFATDLMRSRDKSAITQTIHLLRSPLGVHCNPRDVTRPPRARCETFQLKPRTTLDAERPCLPN